MYGSGQRTVLRDPAPGSRLTGGAGTSLRHRRGDTMRVIRTTTIAIAATATLIAAPAAGALAAPTGVTSTQAQTQVRTQDLDVNIGGWAEGSTILPDGDILVSNLSKSIIQRVDGATGEISTVAEVADPSQMVVDGNTLYVVTGNSPASVFVRNGGVLAIDLTTGARRTVTAGLGEANGMAQLPGGDLIVSVTLGHGAGVHRLDPRTGERRKLTSSFPTPNGVAVGPQGQVYVGSTLLGALFTVDPTTGATTRVAGQSTSLDDFDVRSDGTIVGATTLGFIDELDPATGRSRPLLSGYVGGTSVRLISDDRAVVTTATGRVVTVDLP